MSKRKTLIKTSNISLDTFLGKRPRGRPQTIPPAFVRGCADGNRIWLERNWDELKEPLLGAQTEQEVTNAFQNCGAGSENFFLLARVILSVLRDPKFPKLKKAQINYLADSIAGGYVVTPRRSRDICAEERKADANRHYIKRYEYWIECSCRYEGFSLNRCCKKCGAVVYVTDSTSESKYAGFPPVTAGSKP